MSLASQHPQDEACAEHRPPSLWQLPLPTPQPLTLLPHELPLLQHSWPPEHCPLSAPPLLQLLHLLARRLPLSKLLRSQQPLPLQQPLAPPTLPWLPPQPLLPLMQPELLPPLQPLQLELLLLPRHLPPPRSHHLAQSQHPPLLPEQLLSLLAPSLRQPPP